MSLAWQHFLSEVGISDEELAGDNDLVRFAVEEALEKYQSIINEKEALNLVCCFNCHREFNYPNETNKVLCPFCQTVNQCTYVTKVEPSGNSGRPLGQSCNPRIGVPNYAPPNPQLVRSSSVVNQTPPAYLPSYANFGQPAANTQANVPSYISGLPQVQPSNPAPPSPVPSYAAPYLPQTNFGPPGYGANLFTEIPLGTVPVCFAHSSIR